MRNKKSGNYFSIAAKGLNINSEEEQRFPQTLTVNTKALQPAVC